MNIYREEPFTKTIRDLSNPKYKTTFVDSILSRSMQTKPLEVEMIRYG